MIRLNTLNGTAFCRAMACFIPTLTCCLRLSRQMFWSRYRARLTERKLLSLSDHQLKDIGISRCQIWQLANDGASLHRRGIHGDH